MYIIFALLKYEYNLIVNEVSNEYFKLFNIFVNLHIIGNTYNLKYICILTVYLCIIWYNVSVLYSMKNKTELNLRNINIKSYYLLNFNFQFFHV